MSTPSVYDNGQITVTEGSVDFVGVGTAFTTQIKHGSQLNIGGVVMTVDTVIDDFTGTFVKPWPGPTTSDTVAYHILTWNDGGEIAEYIRVIFERLIGKGMGVATSGVPVASDYQANDLVYNRLTGTLYIKDAGVMQALLIPGHYDAQGYVTNSPSDRDLYDDGQGDLADAIGRGLTFFSISETGFYILLSPGDPVTGSPAAIWSDLISIAGAAGEANLTGSSSTGLSLGTGSKVFTVETNRQWTVGSRLRAASASDPSNKWMEGTVASYSGTTLTLTVDKVHGSGSVAAWDIGVAGEPSSVAGADGVDPGLLYTYSDAVSPSGADTGEVRANNADLTAVTELYFSHLDRTNNDVAAFLATVGDSTSTTKGVVVLKRPDGNAQTIFKITGASVPDTDFTTVPVIYLSGADAMTDGSALSAEFELRGDAGSGANAFTDLEDAPASYSGAGGKFVRVNAGATELEFVATGDAALKNTGTAAGTVAAGDDSRIVGAIQGGLLTTRGDTLYRDATGPQRLPKGVSGQVYRQGANDPGWSDDLILLEFVIDGGGATITTGVKGDLVCGVAGTIVDWTLLADQSGSIVVDIWKDTYANFPPVVGDTITASAKPTISSATKGQSATLTGWTTAVAAGDVFRFNIDSVTTIQRVSIILKIKAA
jgi:hypothetical protein